MAALFFCCTIAGTVALGVFCRKRNMVFPLETKSDAEDDEDAADDCNDAETVPSTSNNSHHHHHHHHRSRQEDSVSVNMYTPTAESPQPSASHAADTVSQLFHQDDHHFRFTDSPFPVASAHARYDAACCREAAAVHPDDLNEANFRAEQSEVSSDQFSTASRINYDVAEANDAAAAVSSPSPPSSSFFTFFSLISTLHKRHVLRSVGHVLNSRWIRRRVPAAATGDQSAPSDAAHDHVDMTSLLPAI